MKISNSYSYIAFSDLMVDFLSFPISYSDRALKIASNWYIFIEVQKCSVQEESDKEGSTYMFYWNSDRISL